MRFSSTSLILTFAAIVLAAPTAVTNFGLIIIRSGSVYQYQSIGSKDSVLAIVQGNSDYFDLKSDSSLYDRTSKKYVSLKGGIYVQTDTPDKSFSISGGYLVHGSDSFYACPYGSTIKITSSCKDSAGSPVGLKVLESTGTSSTKTTKTTTTVQATTTVKKTTGVTTTTTCVTSEPTPVKGSSSGKIQFGVIAIHSGTQFQNAPIKKVPTHLHVFSVGGNEGTAITLTLNKDGTLTDEDGVGINWDSQTGEFGDVDPFGQQKPTTGFSIANGYLLLNGKGNWKACPSGPNKFSLANNDCTGGTSIGLSVVNPKTL